MLGSHSLFFMSYYIIAVGNLRFTLGDGRVSANPMEWLGRLGKPYNRGFIVVFSFVIVCFFFTLSHHDLICCVFTSMGQWPGEFLDVYLSLSDTASHALFIVALSGSYKRVS